MFVEKVRGDGTYVRSYYSQNKQADGTYAPRISFCFKLAEKQYDKDFAWINVTLRSEASYYALRSIVREVYDNVVPDEEINESIEGCRYADDYATMCKRFDLSAAGKEFTVVQGETEEGFHRVFVHTKNPRFVDGKKDA